MSTSRNAPCKVNFLLNILGKRGDGFHELETVMHPVAWCDRLHFEREGTGIALTCSDPALDSGPGNLVFRAAEAFAQATGHCDGVRIHLEKKIPLAAGLGGGSSDAAATLLGLNEIFGSPLSAIQLTEIAARLGSDVPFFLQLGPALATGRGERVQALDFFPALRDVFIVLIHPGFGIATAWAYQQLARFPAALNGQSGRAAPLIISLKSGDLAAAGAQFYNSLETPALCKYPLLVLFQEFFRDHGALATLMSGSGSTTFALFKGQATAETVVEKFKRRFGESCWIAMAELESR